MSYLTYIVKKNICHGRLRMELSQEIWTCCLQFPGFAVNKGHEVVWWNPAMEQLTGIAEKDMLSSKEYWRVFYHTFRRLPLDALLCGHTDNDGLFKSLNFSENVCYGFLKIEKSIQDKSLLWVTAGKIFDQNQNVIGAVMFFQVISLRHINWNSPILGEVIMRFPFPIAIILNGIITLANRFYADLLGCGSVQEIINTPVRRFIHESNLELFDSLVKNGYRDLVSGREYHWKYEIGGEIRYITEIPTVFKKGNDTALVSTLVDKTEERKLSKEKEKLLAANKFLLKQLREKQGIFVSETPVMREVVNKAVSLAQSEINIVLLGETGTGKTMLAKIIHEAGPRKDKPFVAVNCAAIPESLLESAFFGHVKGAFTGAHSSNIGFLEAAHQGTLFLDEVAELSPALQAKLLHAVETKHFTPIGSTRQKECDIRIISATHRNPAQMVEEGKLREDFYYRIFVIDLFLPPLRERREDIPLLIEFFLKRFCSTDIPPALPEKTLREMTEYSWPGNIRELQNAVLRFIATGEIRKAEKAGYVSSHECGECGGEKEDFPEDDKLLDIEACKAEAEKRCLLYALHKAKGNKSHAARLLDMNLRTFHRYCAKYDIACAKG